MEENKDQNYITLFEAAKICSYSEPYLRLRSRQGKLKSIKLGKKWVTTATWVSEYADKAREWNDKMAAKKAFSLAAAINNELLVMAKENKQEREEKTENNAGELLGRYLARFAQVPYSEEDKIYLMDGGCVYKSDFLKGKTEVKFASREAEEQILPVPTPKRNKMSAMGQILPSPEIFAVRQSHNNYEHLGIILSGAMCAVMLFLVLANNAPAGTGQAAQANIGQAIGKYEAANINMDEVRNLLGMDENANSLELFVKWLAVRINFWR